MKDDESFIIIGMKNHKSKANLPCMKEQGRPYPIKLVWYITITEWQETTYVVQARDLQ